MTARKQRAGDTARDALESIRDTLTDDELDQDEAVEEAVDIADSALENDDGCGEDDEE